MTRRVVRALAAAACAAAAFIVSSPASAQASDWPAKPVRFIVPFPPGGTVDPLARLLGTRLSAALGQQFIVDNRPGEQLGMDLAVSDPAALQKFLLSEMERWGKVVRQHGIKAD